MRSGKPLTHQAGSQSFFGYGTAVWQKSDGGLPVRAARGDIAVFRHRSDPVHGHVAFFDQISPAQPRSIDVIGGNQIKATTHMVAKATMRVDTDLELIQVNTSPGLRVA